MREIKFRWFDCTYPEMHYCSNERPLKFGDKPMVKDFVEVMQYTGLKDKTGIAEVYEGDIIDSDGNIKGNIYEMDKTETDTVIQGFGTKTWCETYRRAILLGLKDAK